MSLALGRGHTKIVSLIGNHKTSVASRSAGQTDQLRNLLVAMVEDVRVVLIETPLEVDYPLYRF